MEIHPRGGVTKGPRSSQASPGGYDRGTGLSGEGGLGTRVQIQEVKGSESQRGGHPSKSRKYI